MSELTYRTRVRSGWVTTNCMGYTEALPIDIMHERIHSARYIKQD